MKRNGLGFALWCLVAAVVFAQSCNSNRALRPNELSGDGTPTRRRDYSDRVDLPRADVKFELTLHKERYLPREPIRLKVSVTNVGDYTGRFSFDMCRGLLIKDSDGMVYPGQMWLGPPVFQIEPGETLETEYNIFTCGYGVPHDQQVGRVIRYLPPGTYTIQYPPQPVRPPDGSPESRSDIDTFEVVEPQGVDAKALLLLVESTDLRLEKKDQQSLDKLHELLEKYPESGYVPSAMLLSANEPDKWLRLIRAFPESREAVAAVKSIYTYLGDPEMQRRSMQNLIEEYPDTDIAREARRFMRGIFTIMRPTDY